MDPTSRTCASRWSSWTWPTWSGADFRVFDDALAAGGASSGSRAPGLGGVQRRQLDELTELAKRHRGAKGLVHLSVA